MCIRLNFVLIIFKAIQFSVTSKKVKQKMWWANVKMKIILGVVVILVITIIVVVIIVEVPKSSPKTTKSTTTTRSSRMLQQIMGN